MAATRIFVCLFLLLTCVAGTAGAVDSPVPLTDPLIVSLEQYPEIGRLGITLQLGTNTDYSFSYLFDTGSFGFLTAKGSTAAWAHTIDTTTTNSFSANYTGTTFYQGDVAKTTITFTSTNGTYSVPDVALGVITNTNDLATWNTDINHVDTSGHPSPIPPDPSGKHYFYGTFGAGLTTLATSGNSPDAPTNGINSVLQQIPVDPTKLKQGFIVDSGGNTTNGNASLTIGLKQEVIDSFPIKIRMPASTGNYTSPNNTTVALYDEAQGNATLSMQDINTVLYGPTQDVGVVFDTGGLNTTLFRPGFSGNYTQPNPHDSGALVLNDGYLFSTTFNGTTTENGLNWQTISGLDKYVNIVSVSDPFSSGTTVLNTGIDIFYQYVVMFDTTDGIIGLRPIPVPEPSTGALLFLCGILISLPLRRKARGETRSDL